MPLSAAPRVSPGRGLRVLYVRGVPVYLSPFAALFALLCAVSFAQVAADRLPTLDTGRLYLVGIATAGCFLGSLFLHEVGHAMVARRLEFDVRSITLYGFAGFTEFRPEPRTPGAAFLVAVVGPVVNLLLGVVAWVAYSAVGSGTPGAYLLFDIAWLNLLLGVFNLLPGLPLDGGQVLASGVWRLTRDRLTATRVAAYAGFVVAGLVGLVGLVNPDSGFALLMLLTAGLLGVGAAQGLRRVQMQARLPGLSAGGLARRTLPVDGSLSLAEVVRRASFTQATAVVVVDSRGRPRAIMNGAAADAVAEQRRPWVTVNEVSRSLEEGLTLPADLGGDDLLAALEATPASEYLVVGPDDVPVGVLAMVDLVARLDPGAAQRLMARR